MSSAEEVDLQLLHLACQPRTESTDTSNFDRSCDILIDEGLAVRFQCSEKMSVVAASLVLIIDLGSDYRIQSGSNWSALFRRKISS